MSLEQGWTEIVPVTPLRPGYPDTRLNRFEISNECVWTHVRLNIFPDGGVARLHLYGQARPRWEKDHASQVRLLFLFALTDFNYLNNYLLMSTHFFHYKFLNRLNFNKLGYRKKKTKYELQ